MHIGFIGGFWGQRPTHMPVQGNALGKQPNENEAVKAATQGVALGWLVACRWRSGSQIIKSMTGYR